MLKVDWYAEVRGEVTDKTNLPQAGQRSVKQDSMMHKQPGGLKRLVDAYDSSADLDRRARSYLHANCSSCHVEAGGGNAAIDLEFGTARDKMRLIGEKPLHQSFDLERAGLVVPGYPERSVLAHRVGLTGPGRMPPLATSRVDERGLALLREWIREMQ
jgi:mono/diheme cytochrome c family protein